jgi:hypothetical protein
LNTNHRLIIVAASLDPASQRIVKYLSQTHGVGINTATFTVFAEGGRQLLAADWRMDQAAVVERTERRVRAPWGGNYYVNAGDGEDRAWSDMRRHGFVTAGNGPKYAAAIQRLAAGDSIYVYQKGRGYVGHGIVAGEPSMARDAVIGTASLTELPLDNPDLLHDRDNPALAEWVAPVRWTKAVSLDEAKTFPGAFANQNVVCRLSDATTLAFVRREFGGAGQE